MASVTYGGGITNVVGSHGGTTFARNKGGAYMKAKVRGVNPRSELQLVRRTNLGYLAKYWTNTLTDSDRLQWNTFAATTPVINRMGNTGFLSGQQIFCKLSSQLLDSGGSVINTPPVTTAVGSPVLCTVDAQSGGGGHINVTNGIAGATGSDMIIAWISPPLNPGVTFISSLLRRMPTLSNPATTHLYAADYVAQYGAFPTAAGQRVIARIQVVNTTTGVVSSMLQGTTLWA